MKNARMNIFYFRSILFKLQISGEKVAHNHSTIDLSLGLDKTNLFYRSVKARRRNFDQDSCKKVTGKLRKTLRSSS